MHLTLEEGRLEGLDFQSYPWLHERHRIFPQVLQNRPHAKMLDVAAGMGVAAKRIHDGCDGRIICNDISPTALANLEKLGLETVSFDLDDPATPFPFYDEELDVVISMATLEHIIHLDHHMNEVKRILKPGGHLFISVPNYSGIHFFLRYVLKGESFHDPLDKGLDRYEFYAHVRSFTYKTLLRFITSFGFEPLEVYLTLPEGSSKYISLKKRSPLKARAARLAMRAFYACTTPRWALHPVLCFRKPNGPLKALPARPRRVVL